MSDHEHTVVTETSRPEATLGKYIAGFAASILLTTMAYLLVTHRSGSTNSIVAIISGLAFIQFLVQMVFFLHIGEERQPRWKLLVLVFMVCVVLILVGGSIWIMNNLNYRMTPAQQEQYLKSQDSL